MVYIKFAIDYGGKMFAYPVRRLKRGVSLPLPPLRSGHRTRAEPL